MKKRLLCLLICMVSVACVPLGAGVAASASEPDTRYSLDLVKGGTSIGTVREDIYYDHSVDDVYKNPYKAPTYGSSKSNACAVDAGGNAIVYFDRLYDELVEGYRYKTVWGKFTYGPQNDAVDNMFDELYNLMGTSSGGTTVAGFKNGMNSYVSSRGRTLQMTKATGSYYNTNLEYLKSELQQEKLAVIFFDTFSLSAEGGPTIEEAGHDNVWYARYTGCHVMIAYGYQDINYYDSSNNLIRRDTYLYCSTGAVGMNIAAVCINRYCTVDDIYILNIV